uniref:Uncharacterized protein n=1 Tax=Yersinia ruckeri TaxID=29486 RepID=A0A0A8VDT8_YERRU|nr:hypothetical protein CSF007_1780 [Yersinia ruckeri]
MGKPARFFLSCFGHISAEPCHNQHLPVIDPFNSQMGEIRIYPFV